MPNTALITGASSGIGAEFARYHAAKGGDLIITARRKDALEALKAELEEAYQITVHVIANDLGAADGPKKLYEAAKATGAQIDILINNAGFGGHGKFIERDLERDLAMIDLNVKALVSLCHMVGRDMALRKKGKILNVSSSASYMPGPLQATYFATKAYVSSFSQALDAELRDSGVTVTALEPGIVDTDFVATANLDGTPLTKTRTTAASVAKYGYDAMRRGALRAVNETGLRFLVDWIIPLAPRRLVLKGVQRAQSKG